jgi:hypothetical protein
MKFQNFLGQIFVHFLTRGSGSFHLSFFHVILTKSALCFIVSFLALASDHEMLKLNDYMSLVDLESIWTGTIECSPIDTVQVFYGSRWISLTDDSCSQLNYTSPPTH